MMASTAKYVLGIDGGATKSLGLLGDLDGKILVRRETGPSNHLVIGPEAAVRTLVGLVAACCKEAGCRPADLRAAVFGLAGVGADADRERLQESLDARLAHDGFADIRIGLETDARIAFEGAFDGESGIVVIAGTGSVVLGKSPSGRFVSVGGWGRDLGDEGGGYSLGREVLRAIAGELDGMGSSGILREYLASRKGLDTRDQIIRAVYADRLDLASLTPILLEGADKGDAVCREILERAAGSLALQVHAVFQTMGVKGEVGVVMLGGLVDHETPYSRILSAAIQAQSGGLRIRPALRSAGEGALLMAVKLAQGEEKRVKSEERKEKS